MSGSIAPYIINEYVIYRYRGHAMELADMIGWDYEFVMDEAAASEEWASVLDGSIWEPGGRLYSGS
jgi:hypothetical protein